MNWKRKEEEEKKSKSIEKNLSCYALDTKGANVVGDQNNRHDPQQIFEDFQFENPGKSFQIMFTHKIHICRRLLLYACFHSIDSLSYPICPNRRWKSNMSFDMRWEICKMRRLRFCSYKICLSREKRMKKCCSKVSSYYHMDGINWRFFFIASFPPIVWVYIVIG